MYNTLVPATGDKNLQGVPSNAPYPFLRNTIFYWYKKKLEILEL